MTGEPGAFFSLTPDRVLDAVEVGGLRCTGRCLPLRAFENRVYEVELEDERRLVVKFYRPGRWSRETILDEHAFLADLAAAEVPAVAPLDLGTGSTLGEIEGILYAAFPKVRGRTLDELDAEGRRRIGRASGRLHAVGASREAARRPARPGPLAPRPRRLRGRAQGAPRPPGGLRAVPGVRPLDALALRGAAGHAHRLHVGLDRAALGRSLIPPGLPDVPQSQLLESGVRGAAADRGDARVTRDPAPRPPATPCARRRSGAGPRACPRRRRVRAPSRRLGARSRARW